MFLNINIEDSNNYSYMNNIKEFQDYQDIDISNAIKLINNNNVYTFTEILNKLLDYSERNDILQKSFPEPLDISPIGEVKLIEIINENYFFCYYNDKVKINYCNDSLPIYYLINSVIPFPYEIYSVTSSLKNNKIFACISSQKLIKIFNFNLEENKMELDKNDIKDESNFNEDNFIKCIELNDNILASALNIGLKIILWNINNYTKISEIIIYSDICDLLLINSNYFISAHPSSKNIIFHKNINNDEKKILKNIDCIDNYCLSSNKNYILAICISGIAVISKRCKELIQYFEYYDNSISSYKKSLEIDEDNNIYLLYKTCNDDHNPNFNIQLDIMKLSDDKLKRIEYYKKELYKEENLDKKFKIYLNDKNGCFIYDGKIFIL